jgi:peptidyl-prolyl cis-trans isomerase A (cyclophilin A)
VKRPLLVSVAAAGIAAATAAAAPNPLLLQPSKLHAKAPAVFRVRFTTTKGPFVVAVHRAWAPIGADRFYNLVRAGFYDGDRVFRVLPGFVVQFGINGSPKVSKAWRNADIPDDPVRRSNLPGTISFASAGPNTRTTQVFVNLGSNATLDSYGFAPFGRVTSDMTAIAKLYAGYGGRASKAQPQIEAQGEAFLRKRFPRLDRILTARIVR